MSSITVTPLGAGQDVGRSCLLVCIGGKRIMLDCGMHMGYNDDRRFPDFTFVSGDEPLTDYLDAVIISHFHLDHCGALPFMTEMVGYNGPIYMTGPTLAIAPILLEDMRRVAVERKGETNFFTSQMIKDCMKKVVACNLHQVVKVDDELEIKAYYAGHVLGAAMFQVRVGSESLVYTGDYNMTPDRHLGAAWIDKCRPDLLITESTYATTIRDSKRCRERDFLKKVHDCVEKGGKVLIPVFALGRAQELCILLESYWERMNLKVPVFFSMGLTEKANNYYKMFITWTNEKIRKTFVERNMFDFKHIKGFDRSYIQQPGPMVVLSTPGMLHGGLSLAIFEEWCTSEQNMIIMPGYCVSGTVGHKILNGTRKIEFKKGKPLVEVKMSVQYMSFSAHADAKGIMQLISYCEPRNVMLVHGEAVKMEFLKEKIKQEFGIECYMPANGETATIKTPITIAASVSANLLRDEARRFDTRPDDRAFKRPRLLHGVLVMKDNNLKLMDADEACKDLGITPHSLRFTSTVSLNIVGKVNEAYDRIQDILINEMRDTDFKISQDRDNSQLSISQSVIVKVAQNEEEDSVKEIIVSWANRDEHLGSHLLSVLQNMGK